jgi:hypothetical protein
VLRRPLIPHFIVLKQATQQTSGGCICDGAWLGAVSIHSADPATDARHLCRIQAAVGAGCRTVAA